MIIQVLSILLITIVQTESQADQEVRIERENKQKQIRKLLLTEKKTEFVKKKSRKKRIKNAKEIVNKKKKNANVRENKEKKTRKKNEKKKKSAKKKGIK